MKVLHINDLAGVAGALCKYLKKAGHQADHISFMDDHEFGFADFYGTKHFRDQKLMMHFLKGLIPQYDIIHLHFSYTLLDWLYQFHKPIVMHYHGTEIATQSEECRMHDYRCKLVLVAGEQLLQYHPRAKYLPTIVDTDHFKPMPELRTSRALIFDVPYLDTKKAIGAAAFPTMTNGGSMLEIIDRQHAAIPYSELPKTLNRFWQYIDVRYHKTRGLLTDFSKTGLEALASGLDVYCNGQWHSGLPEKHKPENVVKQLVAYYEGILK